MKIIVFSDSHGNTANMINAIRSENPDMLIHCGDGALDLRTVRNSFPELDIRNVCGNCDRNDASPLTERFTVEGKRFFVVHGHEHRAKRGGISHELTVAALESSADFVLNGHTHMPVTEEGFGFMFMNSGTCRTCADPTYGVITMDSGSVEMDIIHLGSPKNRLSVR